MGGLPRGKSNTKVCSAWSLKKLRTKRAWGKWHALSQSYNEARPRDSFGHVESHQLATQPL